MPTKFEHIEASRAPIGRGEYRRVEADVLYEDIGAHGEARMGRKVPKPLKAYRVHIRGNPIGIVFQIEEHSYRTMHHGRIRTKDFYPIRWGWTLETERKAWSHHLRRYAVAKDTRRRACEELLLDAQEEGKL